MKGYVIVSQQDVARMKVEPLPALAAAQLRLAYPAADGLDAGERDLMALATTLKGEFQLCSCDKAAVVAAHVLGWIDRVLSLETLAESVGARPNPRLKAQFAQVRMSEWRTSLLLGRTI